MMLEFGVTQPMSSAFAVQWDKRDDFARDLDCDWVGEDVNGVWLRRHVDAVVAEDAEIQPVIAEWSSATDRAIRQDEVDRLSYWDVIARQTLLAAQNREEVRRMKRRENDGA